MVTKNYRFADVAFTLQMQYPYLEKQCRSYEVEEPGILIAASDEEDRKRGSVWRQQFEWNAGESGGVP